MRLFNRRVGWGSGAGTLALACAPALAEADYVPPPPGTDASGSPRNLRVAGSARRPPPSTLHTVWPRPGGSLSMGSCVSWLSPE